jgi:hypothetical protein
MTVTIVKRGSIESGSIVLPELLSLPDGTEVVVSIEFPGQPPQALGHTGAAILQSSAVGMWSDREDMNDSVSWLNKERSEWRLRECKPD